MIGARRCLQGVVMVSGALQDLWRCVAARRTPPPPAPDTPPAPSTIEDRADADKEPIGNADDPAASGSDSGRSADVAKAGGGAGVKAAVAPAAHITDFSEEDAAGVHRMSIQGAHEV